MSILEAMSGYFSTGNPEQDKMLTALQRRYGLMRLEDQALDSVWQSDDEKLDRQQKRLSIAASKQALGLPFDDDDYEKAMNEDRDYSNQGAAAMFGKHLTDRIPSPSFLAPPAARGLMETRFPNKTQVGALDVLLGDGSILRKGAQNVGKLRGISKFFGR